MTLHTLAATDPEHEETDSEHLAPEPEPEHAGDGGAGIIRTNNEPSDDFDDRLLRVARIDAAEQAKINAIFSYNVLDITKPPLEFHNPYNPRPVMKQRVRMMRNALLQEGFRVFSNENRIMIVIDPSDVDPSCITLDSAGPPKPLRLAADNQLDCLTIIGGQHRREAVLLIKSDFTAKMDRLRAKMTTTLEILRDFQHEPPDTEEAMERKDRLENEHEEREHELEGHEKAMKLVGPWGVILLDASV
jgi:hypothetical protein